MNRIDLEVFTQEPVTDYRPDLWLIDRIGVDGSWVDESHAIDPQELVRSLYAPGKFGIFTCGCGYPGCAGINGGVFVRHAPGLVHWRYRTPMSYQDLPGSERDQESPDPDDRFTRWLRETRWREFTFSRDQMMGAVEAALTSARGILAKGVPHPSDDPDLETLRTLSATRPYRCAHGDANRRNLYLLVEEDAQFLLDGSFTTAGALGLAPGLISDFAVWRAGRPAQPAVASGNAESVHLDWLDTGRALSLRAYREGLDENIDLLLTYGQWPDGVIDPWRVVVREVPRSALDTTSPIPGAVCVSASASGFEASIDCNDFDDRQYHNTGWYNQFDGPFLVPLDLERRLCEWGERILLYEDYTGFDWQSFHRDGIALTREIKTLLGNRCRVVYVRSCEDVTEDTPRHLEL